MIYNTGIFVNNILTTAKKHISNRKLCSFVDLNTAQHQEILLETFMRSWKNFWTEYDIGSTPFKRELPRDQESGAFVFEMTPKNSKESKVSLEFFFRNTTSFEVKPDVFAPSENLRKKYLEAANEVLDAISLEFSLYYSEKLFLQDWFDTLHVHGMSELTGKEALWVYRIHNNAVKYFPAYQRTPLQKQINLLQAGASKALHYRRDKRDLYVYAMFCYQEIKAANAANSFIGTNSITRAATMYTKVVQHDKGGISFGDYLYEVVGHKFRTSIHDSDIWNMLCTGSMVRFAEIQ